jgi:AraC-like DNA-binding protein
LVNSGHWQGELSGFQGVPGIYLLLLCDVIRQMGHDDGQVVEGLGVSREKLLAADSRIPLVTAYTAAVRAVELAGDQGLGLALARALRLTLHGSVGMVAMSSATAGDALRAVGRYAALRAPFMKVDVRDQPDGGMSLHLRLRLPVPELETMLMEAALVGLSQMGEQLVGASVRGVTIHMPGEQPGYFQHFEQDVPVPVQFGAQEYSLYMTPTACRQVPRLADPEVARLAAEQCELEFARQIGRGEKLADLLRNHLRTREEGAPTLSEMAGFLNMSERTLKRRLQEEDVSYRELLDDSLRERACRLLDDQALSISEVAWRLGYNDVSNFSRAFKRWTDCSPRDWRRRPH